MGFFEPSVRVYAFFRVLGEKTKKNGATKKNNVVKARVLGIFEDAFLHILQKLYEETLVLGSDALVRSRKITENVSFRLLFGA